MYDDVERFISRNDTNILWAHGLDVLSHVLQGMGAKTLWDKTDDELKEIMVDRHVNLLSEMMKNPPKYDKKFNRIIENTVRPVKKYRPIRTDQGGEFDVELWLERGGFENDGRKDFYLEDIRQVRNDQGLPITVIIDGSIPYTERDKPEIMRERHDEAYNIALKSESEGRPCRVIAVGNTEYKETEKNQIFSIIIKDYDDPIFPGIWGAFQDSKVANALGCALGAFIYGTVDSGMGRVLSMTEEQIVDLLGGEEFVMAGETHFIKK